MGTCATAIGALPGARFYKNVSQRNPFSPAETGYRFIRGTGTYSDLEFKFHVPPSQHVSVFSGPLASSMTPTLDFETFFATSLDLLVIRDAELKIVKVNQAWEKVLGYRTDELEGQPMLSFIHPDDAAASHRQMKQIETEKDVKGIINRYRCRDGGYRYLEWRAHQEGDLVYGVARDVTERLAIEAEMAEAKAAAEKANRTKSEFLANMSHELRTPLNAIIGFSEMIKAEVYGPGLPRYRNYATDIHGAGQHLLSLINDILDLSKAEAGKLELHVEPVDLADLIRESARLMSERAAQQKLRLTLDVGTLPPLLIDRLRTKQILLNLLSNAIKFTPENGIVSVKADLDQARRVVICVRDTGIGIAPENIALAFEPFRQIDSTLARKFEGTGLGLPLVKELIELHDGEVTLESSLKVGTAVSIRFPAARCMESIEAA